MTERRLFATTTDVGTAMAETALCSEHNTEEWQKSVLSHVSQPDGSDFVFYDCTGNNVLSCQVCGWPQEKANPSTQQVWVATVIVRAAPGRYGDGDEFFVDMLRNLLTDQLRGDDVKITVQRHD